MSGSSSELVVKRKNDNIRTGIALAVLAAASFLGFLAKFLLK